METELLLNELFKIQKRLDSLEEENKKLKVLLEKHINFIDEIRGNEKYLFENAYIDFDPHLKEKFHSDLFLKTILSKLEIYVNSN